MNDDQRTDEVLQLGRALEKIDGNLIVIRDQIRVQKSWGLGNRKKGNTFKGIHFETGARLRTSKEKDVVTITGTSEQVAAARARVEGILALEKIKKSIKRETGARLSICKGKGVVTITGTSEQVAAARARVEEILFASTSRKQVYQQDIEKLQ